jgi:hypothetical protein
MRLVGAGWSRNIRSEWVGERGGRESESVWGITYLCQHFSIKTEGPKTALQLGLVPAAWEVIHTAKLDELPSGHDRTDRQISSWNEQAREEKPQRSCWTSWDLVLKCKEA